MFGGCAWSAIFASFALIFGGAFVLGLFFGCLVVICGWGGGVWVWLLLLVLGGELLLCFVCGICLRSVLFVLGGWLYSSMVSWVVFCWFVVWWVFEFGGFGFGLMLVVRFLCVVRVYLFWWIAF